MADKKLTDASITVLAHPEKGDYFYIVNDPAGSPISKKIYTENAMESLNLGWLWVAASGTYVSTSSFSVSGDYTAYFKIGTKIKLSNTTTKYFYVSSSSYSAPNTTITIISNADYAVANAAVTNIYISYSNPPDFPEWLSWTPTPSASGSMTWTSVTFIAFFKVVSHTCYIQLDSSGTTGGTADKELRFSVPITAISQNQSLSGLVYDSSSVRSAAIVSFAGTSTIYGAKSDYSNFGLGATRVLRVNGAYRI